MTGRRRLLVGYLLLAIASRAWIAAGLAERPLPHDTRIETIRERDGARHADANGAAEGAAPDFAARDVRRGAPPPRSIDVAYRRFGRPGPEAVVLLHGSPGSLQDFDALAARLGPDRFVVVPDLPGFGRSSREIDDHGFAAQADRLLRLLDALGVERAHLVGFSWGGGVATALADRAPERVASLVLVSSIGVQEHELLGDATLNHLIHRLQQVLVTALDWSIPHFGAFDGGHGGRGFTRSFLDGDQRPLRTALARWHGPLLIVHGRDDFLVPPAAAREHHRIVPQSRLVWIDGGHLVLMQDPDAVARALVAWLEDADADRLPRRAAADPARVAAAAMPFDPALAGPQDGLGWLVFAVLVFAASMVSEDLTCIGVGLLVARGRVPASGAILACVFALVAGDLLLYAGGRLVGPPLLRRLGRDPAAIGPIGERFARTGGLVVLLGRFVPGARLPTYVAAGILRQPLARFTAWLVLAALLWAPLLVGTTAVGARVVEAHVASTTVAHGLGIAFLLVVALAARIAPHAATWRGRRLLRARVLRLVRWEFWPIWAIYLPLAPALLALALRHRSLRVATLVNPPIPGGGLAGESKAALGEQLARVPEHAIATFDLEPASVDARCRRVAALQAEHGIGFPIVLKPDVGERGRDVEIVADEAAVRRHFERHPARTLLQPFVDGDEFGLFYWRAPDAERGTLFSIARKTPRFVTGNGRDRLEDRILADPICLPVAEKLLALQPDRLDWVPADGERVRLTRLGTHSLGCRFLVGEDLRTPALEDAVDRLSRTVGLDYGRYDVRAESEDALRAGRFRVIEFNGLTGEPAHVYDPRYGLFAGLALLLRAWRMAFAIGAAHRARGRAPLPWSALVGLVRNSPAHYPPARIRPLPDPPAMAARRP
ncbi:MAG: alpha/beta fold hydrolase [Myxococcota bacterium]